MHLHPLFDDETILMPVAPFGAFFLERTMPNVPSGAAPLLALIRRTETGVADEAKQYRTIIGHKEAELPRPITDMTVDEILAAQPQWVRSWKLGSGAAGAYQIIRKTLNGLKAQLKLTGGEKFTPALQDRMAMALLKGRGFDKFMAGTLSENAFGLALAKEWASFPVFQDTQGGSRKVKAGQSYYAGDGLNKALVSVSAVRNVLAMCKQAAAKPAEPVPDIPAPPTPQEPETPAPDAPTQFEGGVGTSEGIDGLKVAAFAIVFIIGAFIGAVVF